MAKTRKSTKQFTKQALKKKPLEVIRRPDVAVETLDTLAWIRHSVQGWLVEPKALGDVNGVVYAGGWLYEKGVARAWIVVPPLRRDGRTASFEMHLNWLNEADGSFERFGDAATRWVANTQIVDEHSFEGLILTMLRADEPGDVEKTGTIFGVYLSTMAVERRIAQS